MTFILENSRSGKTREFETRAEAQDQRQQMIGLGVDPEDLEIKQAANPRSDGGPDVDIVDHTEPDEPETTEIINDPDKLSEDPIGWLESINNSFVNTIKGTPAISKQGFRFIQAQFGITTEAEVVQWIDDPTGCIVWAKAELPDGQSAEAHGEGYLSETKVDDNEFVRYADTRAKNRAISDLTSAGALAVSELSGEE
jgi:hypothetical protein